MIKKSVIQRYINNFRRHIALFLKPAIGLKCDVHPAENGGAVLSFQIGVGIENKDIYHQNKPTVGRALANIKQRAFAGNLDGFVFSGTNVILENDRLIFIKDNSPEQWGDAAAHKDVERVIKSQSQGAQ